MASASRPAARSQWVSEAGGSSRLKSSSSSAAERMRRAAYTRASTGCRPAAISARPVAPPRRGAQRGAWLASARGRRQKRRRSARAVSKARPASGTCTLTMPTRPLSQRLEQRREPAGLERLRRRLRAPRGGGRPPACPRAMRTPCAAGRAGAMPAARARPSASGSAALTERQGLAADRGNSPAPHSQTLFTGQLAPLVHRVLVQRHLDLVQQRRPRRAGQVRVDVLARELLRRLRRDGGGRGAHHPVIRMRAAELVRAREVAVERRHQLLRLGGLQARDRDEHHAVAHQPQVHRVGAQPESVGARGERAGGQRLHAEGFAQPGRIALRIGRARAAAREQELQRGQPGRLRRGEQPGDDQLDVHGSSTRACASR